MNNSFSVKSITITSMFIAISAILSNFKIWGSVSFDAAPAFLASYLLGGTYGAFVGVIGHLVAAMTSGFPLSFPLHIIIALEMGLICYISGFLFKDKGKMFFITPILTFLLNSFVAPLILIFWKDMGLNVYIAMLLPLTIVSFANVLVAVLLYPMLKKFYL